LPTGCTRGFIREGGRPVVPALAPTRLFVPRSCRNSPYRTVRIIVPDPLERSLATGRESIRSFANKSRSPSVPVAHRLFSGQGSVEIPGCRVPRGLYVGRWSPVWARACRVGVRSRLNGIVPFSHSRPQQRANTLRVKSTSQPMRCSKRRHCHADVSVLGEC